MTMALTSLSSANYIGPSANLFIANAYISPDGFNRSTVLAGATQNMVTFPGPLVAGNKGDTFHINVINTLNDPSMMTATTVHWHGLFQKESSWADGVAGVSQCPIESGNSFMYEFEVPDQAGTFWYHSHYSTQYCDGLRGPLVVYDPSDPHRFRYDFDDSSTIITLADWYHTPSLSAGPIPTSNATLINGKGRDAKNPTAALAVINVLPNKRYRFRLLAMSCDPDYVFSIDDHLMTIIEVDAVNVQPLTVDSLQIFAGQRYSFILHTTRPVSNYWIRALPSSGTKNFQHGVNSAILRYHGAHPEDPISTQVIPGRPLLETNLHPLEEDNLTVLGSPYPGGADVNINIDIGFDHAAIHYTLNGAFFTPPTIPVLLQILSGARTPQELFPPGDVYVLPPNKVVEISMPAGAIGGPHPIHLHGHNFAVVRSAGSSVYNYVNPIRRDVVSLGETGDNVTIRFKTDNYGPWIMHCHVDWHLQLGLAVVLAEDVQAISESSHPVEWDELCPGVYEPPIDQFTLGV